MNFGYLIYILYHSLLIDKLIFQLAKFLCLLNKHFLFIYEMILGILIISEKFRIRLKAP